MENDYVLQYPDLMNGKTIMYNHGFGSSAASGTVKLIARTFPNAKVVAFDLPLHPADAMALLRQKVEEVKPDLIIGTSMGGMYTEMLYGYDRICVNPAFQMAATMKEHGMTGKQTWQNPRQDGETEFMVTKALEKEYKETTEQCFTQARDHDTGRQGTRTTTRVGIVRRQGRPGAHLGRLHRPLPAGSPLPWCPPHGRQQFHQWRGARHPLD